MSKHSEKLRPNPSSAGRKKAAARGDVLGPPEDASRVPRHSSNGSEGDSEVERDEKLHESPKYQEAQNRKRKAEAKIGRKPTVPPIRFAAFQKGTDCLLISSLTPEKAKRVFRARHKRQSLRTTSPRRPKRRRRSSGTRGSPPDDPDLPRPELRSGGLTLKRADLIKAEPSPICDSCSESMWWHGSTEGWGCPVPFGNASCRSSLHRPKTDRKEPWPYPERYPELVRG